MTVNSSLLTFDDISVSVGDDSCNKNEMNTVINAMG